MSTKWLFYVAAVLFVLHQVAQKFLGISLPLADNYLDPLLIMPILLQGITWERQWIFGKKIRLSVLEIVVWTLAISILAEYLFPKWNDRFVADFWDVIMYMTGSTMFYLSLNHNKK